MKRVFAGAAVLAAVTIAAPAGGQQASSLPVTFGISGGLVIPTGDIGNTNGSGFNLQGHATIRPASLPVGLRGDLGLWTTPGKTITPIAGGAATAFEGITWFTANANAVLNFAAEKDATFVPYVIGGAGIYNGSQGIGTKFGLNAGGGVTFKLSGFDAFAEARFHNVFTDIKSSRLIPLSFGVNFRP